MNKQIRALGVAMMVLFCALLTQLTNLQLFRASELANDPRNTRVAIRDFNRARGVINSADGVVLARSVLKEGAFKRQREYPEGSLFAHVTGFFSFTYGAQGGIEQRYNRELSGKVTRIENAGEIFSDTAYTENVTVTITKALQDVARTTLDGRRGSIVALDPRNGAILAMYSNPSYDPSPLSQYDQKAVTTEYNRLVNADFNPMRSRAFGERFAPGSTFKVITAASVLEEEPKLARKTYPTLSSLDIPQTPRNLPNFGGGSCGGALPALLQRSCNTGFAQIGLDLGGDKLTRTANAFGFNKQPPIDLAGAVASSFPDESSFDENLPALAYSAIGQQDVAASPLMMALVASGVANNGVIQVPHVMKEVRDNDGNVVETWRNRTWMRPMSNGNAEKLRDMMIKVVNGGTATRAAVKGVQVAAKTGTAQLGSKNITNVWIIAFAPAEAPRVAIAVLVESQPGIGTEIAGGRVAAPMAAKVMKAALEIVP